MLTICKDCGMPVYEVTLSGTTDKLHLDPDPTTDGTHVIPTKGQCVLIPAGAQVKPQTPRFHRHDRVCRAVRTGMVARRDEIARRRRVK